MPDAWWAGRPAIRWTRWMPHPPHPRQHAFLWVDDEDVLYGGAAGGGKSDALLLAALQYADVPGYSAGLFRRTFADLNLPGALIPRSKEWLSRSLGMGAWNEQRARWTFPSGATLTFGYLQQQDDHLRYQGAEYQFIGVDEASQIREEHLRYLFSRLRKPEMGPLAQVPLRMRLASNPGDRSHRYLKRRYIEKQVDLDDPEDTVERAERRIFIPAKLQDNPSLDQTAYRSALAQLDPQTRAQLLDGDWDAREPGNWVFDHLAIQAAVALGARLDQQMRDGSIPPPNGGKVYAGADFGDFATAVIPLWPLERGGVYVPPVEMTSSREDLEWITEAILRMMAPFPHRFEAMHYDASFAQSARTFVGIAERKLGPCLPGVSGRPNTVPVAFARWKDISVKYIRLLLNNALAGKDVRVLAISPRNVGLIEQLRLYREDEFGKFLKGGDDLVDSLIAGVKPWAKQHRAVIEQAVQDAKRSPAPA